MNNRGQFSIIAALLVLVILVSTVIMTYSMILNNSIQVQPQVLTPIDETNSAIKDLLGFSVGYYGSVIKVSGDNSFANQSTWNYTISGLQYVANTHADWGAGFSLTNLTIHTYWFNSTSFSTGYLAVSYNLTKIGIYGMQYAPSCGLTVQTANTTGTNQTTLIVTQDQNQPVTNLQAQNFQFFNYTNSAWQLASPNTSPAVYANGTYQIQPPAGTNANSYIVQVQDQRGITVVASQYSSYMINLTWPTPSLTTSSYNYVNNNTSNVDAYSNMGAESNFTAQQYGPDKINDTLIEGNVPIISGNTQYVQTNNQQYDTNIGAASNFPAEKSTDNNYDTLTEANAASVSYIPITFTNSRSSATPNPFQEKITWNPSSYTSYEASALGNIRFYSDSALTTPLYAWLESCTPSLSNNATNAAAWIKLTSPIAANGGTLTIYMAFLSTSTGFDGNYWGDSPNLSGTYGAYDNGFNVFSVYDGFKGTSLNTTKWTTVKSSGGSIVVNNRITITTATSNDWGFVASATQAYPMIAEAYLVSANSGVDPMLGVATTTSSNNWIALYNGYSIDAINSQVELVSELSSGGTFVSSSTASGINTGIWNLTWSATGSESASDGLHALAGSSSSPAIANYRIYIGQSNYGAGSNVFRWARMRAYPPSNVMPSASFGSVTSLPNYQLDLERQWTTASYNANSSKLLCIKTGAFNDSEALEVDVWNGAWTVLNNSLAASSWNNMSVTSYLTSATFNIRFIDTIRTGDPTRSAWQIDSVMLYTSNSTDNYHLDLEEQWTNASYTGTNKDLDIFTGPFSSPPETLSVQWWNATNSSWLPIVASLNPNSWNNMSVTTYLTGSNFTIRFLDGSQTGDAFPSSWQIDAALLRNDTINALGSAPDTLTVELLQNGTMRWLGQSLQLTTQSNPIPPLAAKSIHLNQTINGVNNEVPFQIEDWSPDYMIPLGLTSNSSIFGNGNMIVFLANSNVSKVTVWWNGSDIATQTPNAYINRYFTQDSTTQGKLTNSILTLQFTWDGAEWIPPVNSSVGSVSSTANFMRINNNASTYGAGMAWIITSGVVRDIVQQEAEWSNGAPNCPNIYSQIVLTLPANATYYTYQLRAIFVQSQQNRNITDICPINLTSAITQTQTENGNSSGVPTVSAGTGLFYNQSAVWTHHWSQFISGTSGAGIMFTDSANGQLYVFDTLAKSENGNTTGCLRVSNSTAGTIELLPVKLVSVNFTYPQDVAWYGAVSTFNAIPIYQTTNGLPSGSWMDVEYPPTGTAYTGP